VAVAAVEIAVAQLRLEALSAGGGVIATGLMGVIVQVGPPDGLVRGPGVQIGRAAPLAAVHRPSTGDAEQLVREVLEQGLAFARPTGGAGAQALEILFGPDFGGRCADVHGSSSDVYNPSC
jgi:hypothetical protein